MRYCVFLLLGGLLGTVYGCGSAGAVIDSLSNNTSGDQVKGAKLSELKIEVRAEPPQEEAKPESAPPSAPAEEVISYAAEPPATEALTPEAAVAPLEKEAMPAPESAPLPEEGYYTSAESLAPEAAPTARIDAPAAANGNKDLVRRVFYGTDRKVCEPTHPQKFYGNERGELQLGFCEVSIPPDHKMGELESPKWWKLEFSENPNKHIVLLKVQELSKDSFFTELRSHIDKASDKEAFVFVHGYNVTFEDAARRTAQMSYDLGFGGAPFFIVGHLKVRLLTTLLMKIT